MFLYKLFRSSLRLKARLHRRFLSQQLNAIFFRTEVATSCDFIAILVQFVGVNVSTSIA